MLLLLNNNDARVVSASARPAVWSVSSFLLAPMARRGYRQLLRHLPMLHHRPPSRQFLLERATGVRRTGGRQSRTGQIETRERWQHAEPEAALGGGAVEIDVVNADSGRTGRRNRWRSSCSGRWRNPGCRAHAGLQRIPQRNAPPPGPASARRRASRDQNRAGGHDRPEGIARMGVILPRRQRCHPRHAAEDQHSGVGQSDGRKAGTDSSSAAAWSAADCGQLAAMDYKLFSKRTTLVMGSSANSSLVDFMLFSILAHTE